MGDRQRLWCGLLVLGAIILLAFNTNSIHEITIFAFVLMLQSLPFLSAVMIAILENSRANDFQWWRNTTVRTAELIGLRPVAMPPIDVSRPEAQREAS